ncbi:carbohydrate ABC transporter substrate-binding protein [Aquibacillus halophilus]|uniref:Carbohydrate ABC transporter substrate-binding protein n=1 Tax=Aquibacillus halophilus TaxID=930132 RepID=A0A6A8DFJ1_9BACI|nr:carbohydrate ABC transporter substrate-binding protein [Aquibacillus halophilus]MRH43296.1 carbohydrate ABC transporter substrate-binding protein [Aquibacillus halophilus]
MNSFLKKFFMLMVLFSLLFIVACSNTTQETQQETDNEPESSEDEDSQEPEEDTAEFENMELDVAAFEGGYGSAFWDALKSKFEEAYPGVTVNLESNPNIGDMIRPQIVGGNAPDVIYLNQTDQSGVTQGLIKDQALVDITDIFESESIDGDGLIKDKILPGALESIFMSPYGDGKVYLAPYNYTIMGLWYNNTLFEEEGIEAPTTWDEFYALQDKAEELDRSLFTYQGTNPGYLEEILIPAVYNLGGQEALDQMLIDYDPEFWNSETALEALGIFEKIANEGMLMDGTVALNHTQSQTEFMQGNSMFVPNGNWFEGEMAEAPREDGFIFGFAGVPTFDSSEDSMALASFEQVYIPKSSDNIELAKEFLKFMYTEEAVKLNGEHAEGVMAVQGAADLVQDHITESSYESFKAVEEGMYAVSGNFGPVPEGVNIEPRSILFDQVADVMNGDMSAEEWAAIMYDAYEEVQSKME